MQRSETEQKEPVPFAFDTPGAGIDEGELRREVGVDVEADDDR